MKKYKYEYDDFEEMFQSHKRFAKFFKEEGIEFAYLITVGEKEFTLTYEVNNTR